MAWNLKNQIKIHKISIYEAIDNLKEWVTKTESSTSNNSWKNLLHGVSLIPPGSIKDILLFNIVREYYKTAVSFLNIV
jgi:hypothetical protein